MRILVGFIWDGKSGGIDAYLMAFARVARDEGVNLDFLTNEHCEELASELDGMGHRLYEIATLHDRASQRATIFSLCEKNGYEAAYFNVSTALMYPVVKDVRDAGVSKIAVHSHASAVDVPSKWKQLVLGLANRVMQKRISDCATYRFACSRSAATWLFGTLRGSDGVVIVPNPVDVERCIYDHERRSEIRRTMGLDGKFVVGSVTAMKRVKNPHLLIDSFAVFSKKCTETHLLVVGGGELQDEVLRYANCKLESGSFSFLGKREDVGDLLQAFDAFALTSEKEGLSIAAIEAQVAGLPCVLSSGVPDEAIVVPELVFRLPKNAPAQQWSEAFSNCREEWQSGSERRSRHQEVVCAGYAPSAPRKAMSYLLARSSPNEQ